MDSFFSIILLIMSVVIHEICHGYAAEALGDPTARYAGRLSLNPLKHIDPIGSIIVPFILAIIPPHMVFGWAKPVPVNPYNLKNQRWGEVLVAAAGPASNLSVAIIFGLVIRFSDSFVFLPVSFFSIATSLVLINLLLAVFNLVPIPPLDGSKIFFGFIPYRFVGIKNWLESNSFLMILIFIFFVWQFVDPLVLKLFHLITGVSL
ncbi:MAG: site-2 protease family protein [Candidatus Taylorbacteria bacterium]|nr:site-2 protease family protein [Candidatus Taylorbacteria bacterium]